MSSRAVDSTGAHQTIVNDASELDFVCVECGAPVINLYSKCNDSKNLDLTECVSLIMKKYHCIANPYVMLW